MKLFDPTYIRNNVDYSFGDQYGESLSDGYMKKFNLNKLNIEKYYKNTLNKYDFSIT
jgi:hypothetical protein